MHTLASLRSQSIKLPHRVTLAATRLLQGACALAPGFGEVFSPRVSLASQSGLTSAHCLYYPEKMGPIPLIGSSCVVFVTGSTLLFGIWACLLICTYTKEFAASLEQWLHRQSNSKKPALAHSESDSQKCLVPMKEFPIEEDITFPSLAHLWHPLDID